MNRLSPKIARRAPAVFPVSRGPILRPAQAIDAPAGASGDLRLFATSFIGGLAFFGTYIA